MMFQSYFVGIGSIALSLVIYLLELLVCFIQAYIFTTLSAMFIGASVHAH
jgi:F-type H+-transporting ATPase subunit a